jgi:hypothetical protein
MQNMAQIQKKYKNYEVPGKCLIYTIAGGKYEAFKPLFEFMVKQAYPEYDVLVETTNGIGKSGTVGMASERFLRTPPDIDKYDFTLITDVDMLIIRENPKVVEQNMMWMEINGTVCYNNWLISTNQVPGVHFVTKAWWSTTEDARKREFKALEERNEPVPYFYDELMLYRIITESGLPGPKSLPQPWMHHGLHLGACRGFKAIRNFDVPNLEAAKLLLNPDASEAVKTACREHQWLVDFILWLKKN